MNHWSVEEVQKFYACINKRFNISVNPVIKVKEKDKFPISKLNGELVFVPEFFNDSGLNDNERFALIAILYSCTYLDIHKNGYLINDPQVLAKGICETMGYEYIPFYKLENSMRAVRNRIYDEPEYYCHFAVGDHIRIDRTKVKVIETKKEKENVLVTVRTLGYKSGTYKEKMVFTEKELFELWYGKRDLCDTAVNMRRNLYVMSAPFCNKKRTIFNMLKERFPNVNKTVSVTNRPKQSDEIDGKDYYFCSTDDFNKLLSTSKFVEHTVCDGYYYGTLKSEIEKFPENKPLFLIVNTQGKDDICALYPLTQSIFIKPSSFEKLKQRITANCEYNDEESKHTIEVVQKEMGQSRNYNYVITSDDNFDEIVRQLLKILDSNGALG